MMRTISRATTWSLDASHFDCYLHAPRVFFFFFFFWRGKLFFCCCCCCCCCCSRRLPRYETERKAAAAVSAETAIHASVRTGSRASRQIGGNSNRTRRRSACVRGGEQWQRRGRRLCRRRAKMKHERSSARTPRSRTTLSKRQVSFFLMSNSSSRLITNQLRFATWHSRRLKSQRAVFKKIMRVNNIKLSYVQE